MGRIALLVVGLLALVSATVSLTRLAKQRLQQATPPETLAAAPAPAQPVRRGRLGTLVLAGVAAGMLGTSIWASSNRARLAGIFGPPVIRSQETYAASAGTATFDHTALDALLRRFVDAGGLVDYAGMQGEAAQLDGYIQSLAEAPLEQMGRDQRLALWIDAYNAFTLRLILDHYPTASIKDIPTGQRWTDPRWRLGGKTVSLDQIENQEIRPNFREPRIHFALVCAAIGCPKLRNEAYVAYRLEAQLADQTHCVLTHDRWFRFDADRGVVELPHLFQWYGSDFEQAAGSGTLRRVVWLPGSVSLETGAA